MFAVIIFGVLTAPLLVLGVTFCRALVLFWPTMLLLGAVHSHIAMVPSLGWQATFLVVWLLGLLIPVSTSTNKE
jgi:hypothetical protein